MNPEQSGCLFMFKLKDSKKEKGCEGQSVVKTSFLSLSSWAFLTWDEGREGAIPRQGNEPSEMEENDCSQALLMQAGPLGDLLLHKRSVLALMNFLAIDYGIKAHCLSSMGLNVISACVKEANHLCWYRLGLKHTRGGGEKDRAQSFHLYLLIFRA